MDVCLTELSANGILCITLYRPDKLNALNRQVLDKLKALFEAAETDSQIKGILLTGEGKAFCAGADISELAYCNAQSGFDFATYGQQVFHQLANLSKPSIALVNGVALGGGCELACAATLRIASTQAKFAQPEIKLGVIPGFGGTQRLLRFIGEARTLDMCLTARMIDAEKALEWGLVSYVVEPSELMSFGVTLLTQILTYSPIAIQSTMEVIKKGAAMSLENALHLEALHFSKTCASEDKAEGVTAFLEKRKPRFQGV